MTTRTTKTSRKAKRPSGRPHHTEPLAYDAKALDRLLVQGEVIGDGEGRHFPSYQEAADRFGISKASVGRYAKEHNCLARRRKIQNALEDVAPAPTDVTEISAPLDALLASASDVTTKTNVKRLAAITDGLLTTIEEAIAEKRLRPDFADLERVERLTQAWTEREDERAGIPPGMPTLEELQRIHARNEERARTENAAVIGRLPVGCIPPSWVEANLDQLKSIIARVEAEGCAERRQG